VDGEEIKWGFDGGDGVICDVDVFLGRGNVLMAKEFLNNEGGHIGFKKMRGIGVTQHMDATWFFKARQFFGFFKHDLDSPAMVRFFMLGLEEYTSRPKDLPVQAQLIQKDRRKWHVSLPFPLSHELKRHPLRINILKAKEAQFL
jgi:hypothetical protein